MKQRLMNSRLVLIAAGIALGLIAQSVLGVPEGEFVPPRTIDRPISNPDESIELPLINYDPTDPRSKDKSAPEQNPGDSGAARKDTSGLVPPINVPGAFAFATTGSGSNGIPETEEFSHGDAALFEPHGEEVCASGCAASRHPTEELTVERYWQLLDEVTIEPMDRTNNALEALMYYGPQARNLIEQKGVGSLDRERSSFIWKELSITHAKLSIRVIDESGDVRTWLDATRVPFDRRHVFDMQTKDVQPLVTSGTVKRVGLDHIWVRL